MYKVSFFSASSTMDDKEELYGDNGRMYLDLDFRPQVGDIFPINVIVDPRIVPGLLPDGERDRGGTYSVDGIHFLQIEHLIYAGNNVFFAYCIEIKRDDSLRHAFGVRGNLGSLVNHYIDQIGMFYASGQIDRERTDKINDEYRKRRQR